jgi:hypothetical protein
MKELSKKFLASVVHHLPDVFSLFLATGFFLFLVEFSDIVVEKSMFEKLFSTGAGFFAGMLGGGILGWFVGGFGVVAMGTGVGVGAIGAIAIGAAAGAVFGGLTGMSFSFFRIFSNFDDVNINWLGLFMCVIAAAIVFFVVRWLQRRVPALIR